MNKSKEALKQLLIYLMGKDEFNLALTNGYISNEFEQYNSNIIPFLNLSFNALRDDNK